MGLLLQLSTDRVTLTPGETAAVEVAVLNTGRHDVDTDIRIVGAGGPARRLRVEAGRSETVTLDVGLPVGFPAGQHSLAVEATVVGGPDDGTVVLADITAVIGSTSRLSARLDPRHVGTNGKFRITFQNSAATPIRVGLSQVGSDRHVVVRFDQDSIEVPAGGQRSVKARARTGRRAIGEENRRAFTVLAQHQSTPIYLTGVCSRAAAIRGGAMRFTAILCVLAVWAATLVWGVNTVRSRIGDDVAADRQSLVEEELRRSGGGADGEDGGGEDGGADGEAGGAEGEGDGTGDDATAPGARVGGTISGAQPDGVAITLQPLDPEDPRSADDGGVLLGIRGPMAKVTGSQVAKSRLQTTEVTTSREGGLWAFAEVPGPGFYRVEFRKIGYRTKTFVVEIGESLDPVVLDTALEAGPGVIGGTVTDGGAPLGGATVTISDGQSTATTRTPQSGGGIGTFSFPGLSTPGTYTVTVEHDGFGTEVRRIELGPSGSDALTIPLVDGVGSIRGVVTAAPFGAALGTRGDGVEGVTVTVTADDLERTTTSAGGGESLGGVEVTEDGSFFLPQLPLDRSYTVTFSAPGYLTQSQVTSLTREQPNAVLAATLRPAVGRVQGTVQTVPIWTEQDDAANPGTNNVIGTPTIGAGLQPVAGVGLTLANETNTFKTVSTSGTPNVIISGVPPGTYVLTLDLFNHAPARQLVEVMAGAITPITSDGSPVTLTYAPRPLPATASVAGQVTDLQAGKPLTQPFTIAVDGVPVTDETGATRIFFSTDPAGTFSITGLAPGVRRLTFTDARSATDPTPAGLFEVVTVPVRLAEGQEIVGLPVLVRPLPSVGGRVEDANSEPLNPLLVEDAKVCLLPNGTFGVNGLPAPDDPVWGLCSLTATTNNVGEFEAPGLQPNLYFVRITREGYRTLTASVTVAFGAPSNETYVLNRLPAVRLTTKQLKAGATYPTFENVTTNALTLSSTVAGPDQWLAVGPNVTADDLVENRPYENVLFTNADPPVPTTLTADSLDGTGTVLAYLPTVGTYEFTVTDGTRTRTVSVVAAENGVTDVRVVLLSPEDTYGRVFYDYPGFTSINDDTADVEIGVGGIGVQATGDVDVPPVVVPLPTSTPTTEVTPAPGTLNATTDTGTIDPAAIGDYLFGPGTFVGGSAAYNLSDSNPAQLADFGPLSPTSRSVPGQVDLELQPKVDGSVTANLEAADVGELDDDMFTAVHAGGTSVAATMETSPASVTIARTSGSVGLPVGDYRVRFTDPDGRYLLDAPETYPVPPGPQPARDPVTLTRTVSIVVTETGGLFNPPANSKEPKLAAVVLLFNDLSCETSPPATVAQPLLVDHDDDPDTGDALEFTGLPTDTYCVLISLTFPSKGNNPNADPVVKTIYQSVGTLTRQVGTNQTTYEATIVPDFGPAASISGTVTADLGTATSGATISEAVAAMPVTVVSGGMATEYIEETFTSGDRADTVIDTDEDGDTLRPFGVAAGDAGGFEFPALPLLDADNDDNTDRTLTVAADVDGYNEAGTPPPGETDPVVAYESIDPPSPEIDPSSSDEHEVPDPPFTAADVTFESDLKVTAKPVSLTVNASSDAGGDLAATYTLAPVSDALVSSGKPAVAPVTLAPSPATTATRTDLIPLVYKLTVSAANHSDVIRYIYIPPGQSHEIDVTLPAIRRFVSGQVTWNDSTADPQATAISGATVTVYRAGTDTTIQHDGEDLTATTGDDGFFSLLVADDVTIPVPAVPAGIALEFRVTHTDFDDATSGSRIIPLSAGVPPVNFELTPKAHSVTVGVNHYQRGATATTDSGVGIAVAVDGVGSTADPVPGSANTDADSDAEFSLRPGTYRFTVAAETLTDDIDFLATSIESTLGLDGTWTGGGTSLTLTRNRGAWVRIVASWDDTDDPMLPADVATVSEAIAVPAEEETDPPIVTTTVMQTVKTVEAGKVQIDVLDLTPSEVTSREIVLSGTDFDTHTVAVSGATDTPSPNNKLTSPSAQVIDRHTGELTLTLCTEDDEGDKSAITDDVVITRTLDFDGNNDGDLDEVGVTVAPTPAAGITRTWTLFVGTYLVTVGADPPLWTQSVTLVADGEQSFTHNFSVDGGNCDP